MCVALIEVVWVEEFHVRNKNLHYFLGVILIARLSDRTRQILAAPELSTTHARIRDTRLEGFQIQCRTFCNLGSSILILINRGDVSSWLS